MLSFALAFVVLRVLAAINNLLLYEYGFGPLGALVGAVGENIAAGGFLLGHCLSVLFTCHGSFVFRCQADFVLAYRGLTMYLR